MLEFWEELTSAYYRAKADPHGRVVLHCSSGESSAGVADILRRMGYTNVAYLVGGFAAWLAAGQPVEDLVSARSEVRTTEF
jgi:rhodanese-related sulfurtransferase